MPDFSTVEDTLFVPMLGRIYASENYPHILRDEKALSLKDRLPGNVKGKDTQTQYTLMASAVRSTNMDRYIGQFMKENPDGVIVMLGAGLETTFFRNDNGRNVWYEVDLPDVIAYRKELLGENERDIPLAADAFGDEWMERVKADHPGAPVMVTASGLFYYFENDKVMDLFRRLGSLGRVDLVFDTVNSSGMKRMGKYMKQVGHSDASMYHYIDDADACAKEAGAVLVKEEPYYSHISKKGFGFMTSVSMKVSDRCMMVKMEHMRFNG